MDPTIFAYIRRHSWRQQLQILALTVASLPFFYMLVDLPKTIVDDGLGGEPGPRELFGYRFDQLDYLWILCLGFLALVIVNGAFKYVINVYKGIVGERMLRRLRYDLFSRVLRFPLPQFRRISQGELVQMINAEVEPLGGFIGDAYSLPAYQGGMLLTILTFMFVQDPLMGLAAVVLYPIQVYVIPKLQRQVNELARERVRQVRRLAERIGESSGGVRDIRAHDASQYERARFSRELGIVFGIRKAIYIKKFFIKFLNNFLAQLAPFFFYSIGGYLVIQGDLTIGAILAVIAAHEKLTSPWKELLTYYQTMMDARIKYEQVVTQFVPQGLIDPARQEAEPESLPRLEGTLLASGVMLVNDDGEVLLNDVSFKVPLPCHIAVVGAISAGKEELTLVLAGLLAPQAGVLQIGDVDLRRLPEAVTGRRMAHVSNPAQVFTGTIEDNLLYGLKHRPVRADDTLDPATREQRIMEAEAAGNSTYLIEDDWIDYAAAGAENREELLAVLIDWLGVVGLHGDVYQMGLRERIGAEHFEDLPVRILAARARMRERLEQDGRLGRLVERFDPERYNTNATLAENLLFGMPLAPEYDIDRLAEHPRVQQALAEAGILEELRVVGYRLAATMVELFADLPPEHEYFRQFSFISADELPEYRSIIGRATPDTLSSLPEDDRERLLSLPFKFIPARHRLGLVEADLQEKVLAARRIFRASLPDREREKIAFFDPEAFNPASSLQDNILFGKIAYGQANAAERIHGLIGEIIEEMGLGQRIVEVGLKVEAGVNGIRLSAGQRQKLALARALVKRPDVLLLADPLAPLDTHEQLQIIDRILTCCQGSTVIWTLQQPHWAERFEHVIVLRQGRVVEEGAYADLRAGSGPFTEMVQAA